jgi:acyl carrier protein
MASESTIATQIRTALAQHLKRDVSKIRPQDRLREDLGLDSLAMIELLFKIEEHFDLEIPNEDLSRVTTVADVTAYVEEKLGAGAAPAAAKPAPLGEVQPQASRAHPEEGPSRAKGEVQPQASRAHLEEGPSGARAPAPIRSPVAGAAAKPARPARTPAKVTPINAAATRKAAHASPKAAAKKKGSRPA